jgi:phosphatidylserine synthase
MEVKGKKDTERLYFSTLPYLVSILSHLSSLSSLLSRAGYWPKLVGSLLFLLCIIVDGVDGEIARLNL